MLIYSGTKHDFDSDIHSHHIAGKINELFWKHGLEHENESEYISWQNSLSYMQKVLDCPLFSDQIQIAIEYQIPQTAKRVDFIIAGENESNRPHAVVVELKQWERASRTSRQDIVKAYTGGKMQDVAHPSYQAYSYAKTIENYSEIVETQGIKLHPCAYLHNYDKTYLEQIVHPCYQEILDEAPVYIKAEEDDLREFIAKFVTKPSKKNIMYEIDNGKIRPSKALQDVLNSMLLGNREFYMIDEQKLVYETVRKLLENALIKDQKFTVIVEGGPGTGKSVVAIQLLADLISKKYNAQYVTKNAAPRNVYFEQLRKEKRTVSFVRNLFKSPWSYVNLPPNCVDCVLVDEAHRLTNKSGYYGKKGQNQIMELIRSAKVSVFFIDENQIVTEDDIGSVDTIKYWAHQCGSAIYYDESTKLKSQFRCNGSDSYIAFLNDILGIEENSSWYGFNYDYDIQLFDSPTEMREKLRAKNDVNNKARMLAGYCYEWNSRNSHDNGADIVLPDGFRAQWNFNETKTWAIDSDSFDQVGCIHTSQGLEFDYVGVIIGRDLTYKDGQVVTDMMQRAKSDFSIRHTRAQKNYELGDKIIRNTYRTLLTRGQKGCYIYCEDVQLQEFIRKKIEFLKTNY